jgi:Na+-translocating ferredoxin:NAD+ oxidoreductase subunit D
MKRSRSLVMGPPPFVFGALSTASLVWGTVAALAPCLAWAVYRFGATAAWPVASAIGAALLGEALVGLVTKRFTLLDGSAFLTGLLIGLAMPPAIGPAVPAAAALFAIVLVKGAFGGLGANWMNPALGGIAFALLDWPKQMNAWVGASGPGGVAGISGATPLAILRDRLPSLAAGSDPLGVLASAGYVSSRFDRAASDFMNRFLFAPLSADLPYGYVDLILGNRPGAIGELSGVLLLAGSIFLIARRMIRWEIPLATVAAYGLLTWIFGGLPFGSGFFSGDVLFSLFTGSFILVAFFMAVDPVTSPSSTLGMALYGLGIGSLCFLVRVFGSMSEGTAFAVLIMNCLVPMLSGLGRSPAERPAAVGE